VSRAAAALALGVLAGAAARPAAAQPLRLRGEALAVAPAPAGLLVLDADGDVTPWLSAEAVVWVGGGLRDADGATGDALVIAVEARAANDRGRVRLGRFVATTGALRPVHLDGLSARARLPRRIDVELFGGVPVAPNGARGWDWLAGGRLARRIGDWGAVGVAVLERREQGRRAAQELGADAGIAIGERADAGARVAFDLISPGLADVQLVASRRFGALRLAARAGQRSPSHLVPATSVFSVLGDVAAQDAGATASWRAAPRLDVGADLGLRRVDRELAPELALRATLRLDDRGAGAIGGELRRSGAIGGGWLGARATARVPLRHGLAASAELELVRLDAARAGETVWPWGLAALSLRRGDWDGAIAVEASASPEYRHRVDVLAQLGRRWSAR
jgi:hypothetical protein